MLLAINQTVIILAAVVFTLVIILLVTMLVVAAKRLVNSGAVKLTINGEREVEVEAGGTKIDQARAVGRKLATKAIEAGITNVVFDRSGYIYHGRIKALAEGARGERKEDGTNELLQF